VHLSLTAQILWAAGFIEHAALLTVLLMRGRWKAFPVFTAWIGFSTFRTILLVALYKFSTPAMYGRVYWNAAFLDLALQLGVIFELARVVLKPTGTWVHDAKKMFWLYGSIGAVAAAAIAYGIHPSAPTTLDFWIEKGNLFAGMLTLELFAVMLFASAHLGLVGSSHVMRLAQGWTIWAVAGLIAEGAYSRFGPGKLGNTLDYLRTGTYFAVTIYWIITLWRPEPERRTLSPEMQAYLQSLHTQLQSELKHVSSIERH
jgi:hypothetical protein